MDPSPAGPRTVTEPSAAPAARNDALSKPSGSGHIARLPVTPPAPSTGLVAWTTPEALTARTRPSSQPTNTIQLPPPNGKTIGAVLAGDGSVTGNPGRLDPSARTAQSFPPTASAAL